MTAVDRDRQVTVYSPAGVQDQQTQPPTLTEPRVIPSPNLLSEISGPVSSGIQKSLIFEGEAQAGLGILGAGTPAG
jgi:hypothetical protein